MWASLQKWSLPGPESLCKSSLHTQPLWTHTACIVTSTCHIKEQYSMVSGRLKASIFITQRLWVKIPTVPHLKILVPRSITIYTWHATNVSLDSYKHIQYVTQNKKFPWGRVNHIRPVQSTYWTSSPSLFVYLFLSFFQYTNRNGNDTQEKITHFLSSSPPFVLCILMQDHCPKAATFNICWQMFKYTVYLLHNTYFLRDLNVSNLRQEVHSMSSIPICR